MLKVCSCCSRPAGYSLAFVLSTVGTSGRLQQCSKVTLFCDRCMQKLCKSERSATSGLFERVNSAYTALNRRARERVSADDANSN
jgi:hypothetical protein